MLLERSVIHEYVELPKALNRALNRTAAKLGLANISCDHESFPSFRFNRFLALLGVGFLFGQMCYRDISSFSGKQHGDCATNSRVAARDESNFAFQLSRALI